MSLFSGKSRKADAHLQLLGTLYLLLDKIRTEGMLSIENDIENPATSPLFAAVGEYDASNAVVHEFICDVVRLMLSGLTAPAEMEHYMSAWCRTAGLTEAQDSLFEIARLTLIAALEGNVPRIAAEFGRQGIPAKVKPGFIELEDFLCGLRREWRGMFSSREEVEAALEGFYESEKNGR